MGVRCKWCLTYLWKAAEMWGCVRAALNAKSIGEVHDYSEFLKTEIRNLRYTRCIPEDAALRAIGVVNKCVKYAERGDFEKADDRLRVEFFEVIDRTLDDLAERCQTGRGWRWGVREGE